MRLIVIMLSIALLCQSTFVSGQSIAFNKRFTNYIPSDDSSFTAPRRRHCITTRIGEGMLLGGGAFVVTGIVAIAFSTDNNDLGGGALAFAGEFFAVTGLIVFLSGKHYEKNHKNKFSVTSKSNRIGLAYTFNLHN